MSRFFFNKIGEFFKKISWRVVLLWCAMKNRINDSIIYKKKRGKKKNNKK
jgi:hypothetical protein